MNCLKTYSRRNQRYTAGQSYDISSAFVEADETYFGETLWKKAKSKSQTKREEVQKEETAEPTPKKTTKKTAAKK